MPRNNGWGGGTRCASDRPGAWLQPWPTPLGTYHQSTPRGCSWLAALQCPPPPSPLSRPCPFSCWDTEQGAGIWGKRRSLQREGPETVVALWSTSFLKLFAKHIQVSTADPTWAGSLPTCPSPVPARSWPHPRQRPNKDLLFYLNHIRVFSSRKLQSINKHHQIENLAGF